MKSIEMTEKFSVIIDREVFQKSSDGVLGVISAAEKCNTLHQQALKEEREKLVSKFWKESSMLIDIHRKNGDEKKAQGVVDCRILINKIAKGDKIVL